jgi:uncharacterized integral membrane protein
MRVISGLFWLLVAAALVVLGLANRGMVELKLLPDAISERVGYLPDFELPLFLVILGSVGLGLVLGLIWEWIREIPERAEARRTARELERLRAEVAREKGAAARSDVLAGLDMPAIPRR